MNRSTNDLLADRNAVTQRLEKATSQIETLEHNLMVERAERDRFYRELIESKVIIASLERRLKESD